MSAFLLRWFRLIWLFTRGHQALILKNLALRQQLAVYKRNSKRPKLNRSDRVFWIALASVWNGWRRVLVLVHPDTVVRWQRQRFCRYWAQLSGKPNGKVGRPRLASWSAIWLKPWFGRILCGGHRASTASSSNSALGSRSAPSLACCEPCHGHRRKAGRPSCGTTWGRSSRLTFPLFLRSGYVSSSWLSS